MTMPIDTIAAIATPPGTGGVGIVRVSGPEVEKIAQAVIGKTLAPRQAVFSRFKNRHGDIIDQGLAILFAAPATFTGEDVLELQGHGGPVVMDLLLQAVLEQGARLARPGEFSERAFLNDKIDLTQAEAIADLIDSSTRQAARSALRSLQGEFSAHINTLVADVIALRVYVESAIDFPEEEIDFLSSGEVEQRLAGLIDQLATLQARAEQGCLLRDGMTIVIAGPPNAGKSSLLNTLAGRDTAIVTDIPGTTRDVLREHIALDGLPLHIIDTAGLRDSDDPVEQIGIARAQAAIAEADRVLLMTDDSHYDAELIKQLCDRLPETTPRTIIRNKIDLSGAPAAQRISAQGDEIYCSVKNGQGIDLLKQHLKASAGFHSDNENNFIARRRHLDALQRAVHALTNGAQQLAQHQAGELLAEDLREAQQCLNEITGEFTSEDLLGEIFASFCIGK